MIKKVAAILALAFLISFTEDKQQDKEVIIKLPISKVNIILKGLSKLTIEEGQETYLIVLTQAQSQLQDTVKKK